MSQVYFSYKPRTHIDGTGTVEIDDSELSPVALQLFAGTESHQGNLFSFAWDWFDLVPGDFEGLEKLLESTMSRMESNQAIRACEDGSSEKVKQTLSDLLSTALFWGKLAIDDLCEESFKDFVSHHSFSVDILARFSTCLECIKADLEDDEKTNSMSIIGAQIIAAQNIAAREALAHRTDQKLKGPFKDFCKSLVNEGSHRLIRTLRELLSVSSCSPEFKKNIDERTLKRWATECGIEFKAGRPRKN